MYHGSERRKYYKFSKMFYFLWTFRLAFQKFSLPLQFVLIHLFPFFNFFQVFRRRFDDEPGHVNLADLRVAKELGDVTIVVVMELNFDDNELLLHLARFPLQRDQLVLIAVFEGSFQFAVHLLLTKFTFITIIFVNFT